jgi:stage III sporulation protein AD
MDILQIVALGFMVTILSLVLKEQKPLFAFLLTTFAGLVIFLMLLDHIRFVVRTLENLADQTGVNTAYLKIILKIIGIAYIAELGAQTVRDAGQEAMAAKIELAGKMLIIVMAVPIIAVIVETVLNLLPA